MWKKSKNLATKSSPFNKVLLIKHNVYVYCQKKSDKKVNNNEYLNLKELASYLTRMFKCFFPNQSCYNFDPRGLTFYKKGKYLHKKH